MPAYSLRSPYARTPLQRRLSGLALAVGINLLLLFVLMGLGVVPPPTFKGSPGIVVDLIPESRSTAPNRSRKTESTRPRAQEQKPVPKPPRIILPVKPTITPSQQSDKVRPWVEMSSADMAAADISKMTATQSGSAGDSEAVGHGPNGEVLYAAEWARRPTSAELGGYLPSNAPDGYGLIACKTVAGNRVDDCIALDQFPRGSHLAGAVLNAAWQFRVKPPRKGGRPLVGSWVQIRIDYIGRSRSL